MKKNMMMKLASILLVAVLLSTAGIGGTFAKYVTTDETEDQARVAKWGVTALVSGNLYGAHYNDNNAGADANKVTLSTQNSVDASNGTDTIVAPGTKSDKGITIAIAGTPEVANAVAVTKTASEFKEIFLGANEYGVLVKAEGVTAQNFEAGKYYTAAGVKIDTYGAGEFYELHDVVDVATKYTPIVYTLTYADATTATFTDLETMYDAIGTYFNATKNNPNVAIDKKVVITWEWDFEGAGDGADTILGTLAVAPTTVMKITRDGSDNITALTALTESDYCLTTNFDITITVTQVN